MKNTIKLCALLAGMTAANFACTDSYTSMKGRQASEIEQINKDIMDGKAPLSAQALLLRNQQIELSNFVNDKVSEKEAEFKAEIEICKIKNQNDIRGYLGCANKLKQTYNNEIEKIRRKYK